MTPRKGQGHQPWYRTPAATFTAGGVGVAIIGALVVTIVAMSDEWSRPQTTVLTTPVLAPTSAPTTPSDSEPFIITPTSTSDTFTTTVPLSTTEIGLPGEPLTSTDTATSSPPESVPPALSGTDMPTTFPNQRRPGDDSDTPHTTRTRPRLNETRTLGP